MELLLIIGISWLVYQLIKDGSIKQCSDGTDHRRAYNDLITGKIDKKELNKRLSNGYYVNKNNKKQ